MPYKNRFDDRLEWILEIQRGNVPGVEYVRKFGTRPEISISEAAAGAYLWDGPLATYTFLDVNTNVYISSDSILDIGITYIIFYHYESNGLWIRAQKEVTTDLVDGRIFVDCDISGIRFFRIKLAPGQIASVGNIYLSADPTDAGGNGIPDDLTSIQAVVTAGKNQTRMSIFSLASDETGYLHYWNTSFQRGLSGRSGLTELQIRDFESTGFRQADEMGSESSGTSTPPPRFLAFEPVAPKSDLRIINTYLNQNDSFYSGTFGIVIIKGVKP